MTTDTSHHRRNGCFFKKDNHLVFVVCLAALLAFAFQGTRGFWSPDESYYVPIALEMLNTGDYMIPRISYMPYLDKPPVLPWGMAMGFTVLGRNEWGARAFSAICFLSTVMLVFALGKRMYDKRTAIHAAVFYTTMLLPFSASTVLTPDTPLVFWTTAAMLCFWLSSRNIRSPHPVWMLMMFAAFGAGWLTKGPATLIPAGAICVFIAWRGRLRQYVLNPWIIPGLLLFAVIGMLWYVLVIRDIQGAFQYFLDNQVIGRLVTEKYRRNPGLAGARVYLEAILLGTLPWSYIWYSSLKRFRSNLFSKTFIKHLRQTPADGFLACWIVVPLAILLAASSKMYLYLLPVFPALALLTARLWIARDKSHPSRITGLSSRLLKTLAVTAFVLVGLKAAVAYMPHKKDMRQLAHEIMQYLPGQPFELVCMDDRLEALGFYLNCIVEHVASEDEPYPSFSLHQTLKQEIGEISTTTYVHVIVCRWGKTARNIEKYLDIAGASYEQRLLSYGRRMYIIQPVCSSRMTKRFAVIGGTGRGFGRSRMHSLAASLRKLHAEKSINGGIIHLGDVICCGDIREKDRASMIQTQFIRPFGLLLDEGIPIFRIMGHHDRAHETLPLNVHTKHLEMLAGRYYSREFGNGLIEVFFLDTVSLLDKDDDTEQTEWLYQAITQSKAAWKLVATHTPLYSTTKTHHHDDDLLNRLEPIFVESGIDLVLQGTYQVYERLKPVNGIFYITSGNGGAAERNLLSPDMSLRDAGNDVSEGFVFLEIDEETCRISAFDEIGRLTDTHTLVKRHPVD